MRAKYTLTSLMLMPVLCLAQATVSTSGSKYVLIEQSTGTWGGYCPDGSLAIDRILAARPKTIAVSIHDNTYHNDMMAVPEGIIYDTTEGYCSGFPSGSIDRTPGTNGKCGQSRSLWSAMINVALARVPKFDITMTHVYDPTSNALTVWMYAKSLSALTGDFNTNVYITEDSIAANREGYAQRNYYYKTTGHPLAGKGTPDGDSTVALLGPNDYTHDHVLRAMLGGTWGTPGVIAHNAPVGNTYVHKYIFTLPASFNKKHLHLIGLVQKQNIKDQSDRAIANSIQAKFEQGTLMTNDDLNSGFSNLDIYPNPASSIIHVKATIHSASDSRIIITNAAGQIVEKRTAKVNANVISENIATDTFSNGVYLLTLSNEDTLVNVKIVVSK